MKWTEVWGLWQKTDKDGVLKEGAVEGILEERCDG